MEKRMGEWEKRVQRLEESVEKGAKEGERQEVDRAEKIPGKKGRVEGEKGENERVGREKERDVTEGREEEGCICVLTCYFSRSNTVDVGSY